MPRLGITTKHEGRRYRFGCDVQDRGGQFLIVRRGPATTRVIAMANDGCGVGGSFTIPNAHILNERVVPQNALIRPMNTHAGRRFAEICQVRGKESEGDVFIVQRGDKESRVVGIGDDGASSGLSYVVPTDDVLNVRPALLRQQVSIDERGTFTLPAAFRTKLGIVGKCDLDIEEINGAVVIRKFCPSGSPIASSDGTRDLSN